MTEEEQPPLYPYLPINLEGVSIGGIYTIPRNLNVLLTHCTGLNCSKNGVDGLLQIGLVNPDNYLSAKFLAKPGTYVRFVEPTNGSCRCGECSGCCVTIGLSSDEIYNLEIQINDTEITPQYVSPLNRIPVGSKVRTLGDVYGEVLVNETETSVSYRLRARTNCKVGICASGHTLEVLDDEPYYHGKTFLLPNETILEIEEIPDKAKLWATCWEVGESAKPFQEKEYWGLINELPLGSLVRVRKESKGRRILQDGSVLPEGSIEEKVFTVDLQDGIRILKGVFRDSSNFGENDIQPKDFVVPDDLVLNVITTPTESQIWAQVREVDNSNKSTSSLRDTFRTLAERLLRYPN